LAKQLAGYSIEGNRATILADTALAVLSRLKKNNCAALGIQAFDEAFYGNKAYLVENNNIDASRIKTETIETVRKNAGV
jgi:hypothetical protein